MEAIVVWYVALGLAIWIINLIAVTRSNNERPDGWLAIVTFWVCLLTGLLWPLLLLATISVKIVQWVWKAQHEPKCQGHLVPYTTYNERGRCTRCGRKP